MAGVTTEIDRSGTGNPPGNDGGTGTVQTFLRVDGMDCASCVAAVERAASKVGGVRDIRVNLARGRALLRYDPSLTSESAVADAITKVGYPAEIEPRTGDGAGEDARVRKQALEAQGWLKRSLVAGVLWLPFELTHWIYPLFTGAHLTGWWDWLTMSLATVAIAYGAGGFYVSAWKGLRAGTTNMDVLISMGFSTAYFYSLAALLGYTLGWWGYLPHLYFLEGVALLALISFGHYLEARARRSASGAIRELLELAPATALRVKWTAPAGSRSSGANGGETPPPPGTAIRASSPVRSRSPAAHTPPASPPAGSTRTPRRSCPTVSPAASAPTRAA